MRKCILVVGLLVVVGCSSGVARWESSGTLVSVRPAEEPTRAPGRAGTALGDNEMGRTRVETSEGVSISRPSGLTMTSSPEAFQKRVVERTRRSCGDSMKTCTST